MIATAAGQLRDLLDRSATVAIVGASDNPVRASAFVFAYLRRRGRFRLVPVNPTIAAVDGVPTVPDLAAAAAALGGPPDIVDVFRRPSELQAVTAEAIAVGAKAIWYQYGLIDPEAIAAADAAGLTVVVDRCLKVETARFRGDLAIAGVDSGLITSRRRVPGA